MRLVYVRRAGGPAAAASLAAASLSLEKREAVGRGRAVVLVSTFARLGDEARSSTSGVANRT
jgi:hypothetical protein